MQGQYPGNRGGRPCGDRGFDHTDARSARAALGLSPEDLLQRPAKKR
jgi:hypothetical protein